MAFELVDYERLKGKIVESISTLETHHAELKSKVPEHRKAQGKFLQDVISVLDKSPDLDKTPGQEKERAWVLNMAVFLVRDKISREYNYLSSPANSNLYNSLTTSLDINTVNFPTSQHLRVGYPKLEKFLCTYTYIDGNPEKGYLPHPSFGYHIKDDIIYLTNKRAKFRVELVNEQFAGYEAAQKAKTAATATATATSSGARSIFGVFHLNGDGSSKKPVSGTTPQTTPPAPSPTLPTQTVGAKEDKPSGLNLN